MIAGSGMCEGGRIVHHLRRGLEDPRNGVVIVGFMAEHTLGRRLVERRREVKLLGVERRVLAQIHVLDGLSAHADRDDLVAFAQKKAPAPGRCAEWCSSTASRISAPRWPKRCGSPACPK